jgi:hypothetical protein
MRKIETNGKVTEETAALYRELATLRAEKQHLRDRLPKRSRGSQTVRTAVVDAHMLILNAFSGKPTGKLTMSREGMGKRRWAWAVAFLRYAGIVGSGRRKWRNGLEWLITELAECIRLLETAGKELMEREDGYKTLLTHLRDV